MSPAVGEPFLLGVNYWPRTKAMTWWADFDPDEVREEFAMIREIGLTHVRIFLLWESFQPQPDRVSETAVADLRTVADIAAASGLMLEPTFFTGHMSGPNWALRRSRVRPAGPVRALPRITLGAFRGRRPRRTIGRTGEQRLHRSHRARRGRRATAEWAFDG